MQVNFDYRPLPVHTPFHQSSARERALAGAMGSGKSYAICAEAIAWCLEQPGIRGFITRKTIPALRDSTEAVFFDILPHELYKAGEVRRMGGHVDRFVFPNGSVVLFKSMDDWKKHKSFNLGFIAWDEADEIDEETYLGMLYRLRQRDLTSEARAKGYTGEITRTGSWLAFNPAGHNWIYDRFINQQSQHYKDGSEWFKSTTFDNPYLPADYVRDLLTMPEPWIKRYVLCQFDEFAGQIYPDWGWDSHVIEPLKEWPAKAAFWMGMDPGTRNPTAGLWVVMNPEDRSLTAVAEYEENYTNVVKHAQAWRGIEARLKAKVAWRTCDPTIATTDRGSNMTLEDQYRRVGFTFTYGPKDHKIRVPALGQLISTGRFKVTKDCPRTFEEVQNYRWEDLTPAQRARGANPREKPLSKNDHLVDCSQYLASRWIKVPDLSKQLPADPRKADAIEVHRSIRRNIAHKARASRIPRTDLGSIGM